MSFVSRLFGGGKAPTVAPYSASPVNTPFGAVTPTGGGGVNVSLSPELQRFFNIYTSAAEEALPSEEQLSFAGDVSQMGQGLFSRAAGTDINAKTRDYYNQVLSSLEPQRAEEESRLANTLFKTGRTGAATGVAGGGYINPEQFSLFRAREEANKNIFLGAEDRARQQQIDDLRNALATYGTGQELLTQPFQTAAGLLGTGVNLAGLPSQFIPYSLQAGQNVTGVNQMNAQIEAQNQQRNLGFWGGLLGAGVQAFNPFSRLGGLFSSTTTPPIAPPSSGGGFSGGIQLPRY
jgi:hypothetical protein